jgi:hypothetical protein
VTTEEHNGHGLNPTYHVTTTRRRQGTPGEREGCSLQKSVYGASAERCCQRTSEGQFQVTNGTRVGDEVVCTPTRIHGAGWYFRIWWVGPYETCHRVPAPASNPLTIFRPQIRAALFSGCFNLLRCHGRCQSEPSRPPPAGLVTSHDHRAMGWQSGRALWSEERFDAAHDFIAHWSGE